MKIGIIGVGDIRSNLARLFAKAGHEIIISYSRWEEKLLKLSKELGSNVRVGSIAQTVQETNVTILSIRFAILDDVKKQMGNYEHKIIIDTNNPYGITLPKGKSAASEIQNRLPGIRLVKAFNTLYFELLLSQSFSDPLTIIPVSSDDDEAKQVAIMLIKTIGYEAFDLGGLDNVLLQEPNGPFYNKVLTLSEAEKILNTLK